MIDDGSFEVVSRESRMAVLRASVVRRCTKNKVFPFKPSRRNNGTLYYKVLLQAHPPHATVRMYSIISIVIGNMKERRRTTENNWGKNQ